MIRSFIKGVGSIVSNRLIMFCLVLEVRSMSMRTVFNRCVCDGNMVVYLNIARVRIALVLRNDSLSCNCGSNAGLCS